MICRSNRTKTMRAKSIIAAPVSPLSKAWKLVASMVAAAAAGLESAGA
jgi:hypothetical protein